MGTRGRSRGRMARHMFAAGLGAVALGVLVASCQDPTQLTLAISTNAKCHDELNATAIYVGGSLESADTKVQKGSPVAQTTTCDSGNIGTLVVTPGNTEGAVVVIAGFFGKSPTDCNDKDFKNCIVARRSFTFIQHTPLTIPIELERDCLNVPCDVSSTCHNGQCFSAAITCTTSGCTKPGENDAGPVDGGPMLFPDGQPEPVDDGSTFSDGSSSDGGAKDSGADVGSTPPMEGGAGDAGQNLTCKDPGGGQALSVDGCGGQTCASANACCNTGTGLMCHLPDDCVNGAAPNIYCCDDIQCPGVRCCIGSLAVAGGASNVSPPRFKVGCPLGARAAGSNPGKCQ